MDKQQTDFLSPIYSLPISRVWRGHANIIFVELGALNDGKGEYTLWISTSFWKIDTDSTSFDGNEEPYEAIDKQLSTIEGLKIKSVEFNQNDKSVAVTFDNGKVLNSQIKDGDSFVSIIFNESKTYLNFEFDGTATFDVGGHKKSPGLA